MMVVHANLVFLIKYFLSTCHRDMTLWIVKFQQLYYHLMAFTDLLSVCIDIFGKTHGTHHNILSFYSSPLTISHMFIHVQIVVIVSRRLKCRILWYECLIFDKKLVWRVKIVLIRGQKWCQRSSNFVFINFVFITIFPYCSYYNASETNPFSLLFSASCIIYSFINYWSVLIKWMNIPSCVY